MDFDTTIVLRAEGLSKALLLDGVRSTIFQLQTEVNFVLILVKEVIEGVSHRRSINLRSVRQARGLLHRRAHLPVLVGVDLGNHGRQDRLDVVCRLRVINEILLVSIKLE